MSSALNDIYTTNDRPDMIPSIEHLLKRYATCEDLFVQLVKVKYDTRAELAARFRNHPFVFEDRPSSAREPDAKRPKVDLKPAIAPAITLKTATEVAASAQAPSISKDIREVVIRDHHGKSRTKSVKFDTTIADILDWYGPRSRPGYCVLRGSDKRLSSDTRLSSLSGAIEIDIKEGRR